MASLARSFKPPAFLSPRRRPAMSGRTLSNSSELSLASNHSGPSDDADFAFSAPGTPAVRSPGEEASSSHQIWLDDSKQKHHDGITVTSPRSSSSRPIAIELPQIKKPSTSSLYTPTEPLSARGDVPGGYFPLHEDPGDRLHRTHPFHHGQTATRPTSVNEGPAAPPAERADSQTSSVHMNAPSTTTPQASASPHISSYLPAGFHDHPLPLGKYYPSNYEGRAIPATHATRPTPSSLMPPSSHSDSKVTTRSTASSAAQDSEVRRKLLQYQRDMVAQATMAATDLLGTPKDGSKPGPTVSQRNATLQELRLSAPAPHKPISPRLLPLGSPGPVTPMELESGVGGYLDKAIVADRPRIDSITSTSSAELTPRTA